VVTHRPTRGTAVDTDGLARAWISNHGVISESIVVIKLVHTAIFLTLLACVLHVTWAGLRGRATQTTALALVAITAETIVFALNDRHCPLTVIVEDLGAEHGQVSDIFLPDWIAQRIFTISTSLLGLGAVAFAFHHANWPRIREHMSGRNVSTTGKASPTKSPSQDTFSP